MIPSFRIVLQYELVDGLKTTLRRGTEYVEIWILSNLV